MWKIRHEGSPRSIDVPTAQAVVEGLRDGDWSAQDEVIGPYDRDWRSIEDHPQFEEIVAELESPLNEPPDETRLDMNPLIDVALVLLIFFIITTTYSSLRRAIELPPEPTSDAVTKTPVIKKEDIKDRSFRVKIWMENDNPFIKIEDKAVELADLKREIAQFVKTTGRKELYAEIAGDVPWGIEAELYDAAKGAEIHQIYLPKGG